MSRNLAKAMNRLYEAGGKGRKGATLVMEAFKAKKFSVEDFSIKSLALETMGDAWAEALTPRNKGGIQFIESSAVDSSAFLNLANVVLSGKVLQEFAEADINVSDALAETSNEPYISAGRDIEVTRTDAQSVIVQEGRSFPRYGLGENWRTYPDTEKRGAIVELTKEAISEDRTGTLIRQAATVATEVAMDKNERILKVVLAITDSIYQPQGVARATYVTTAGVKNLLSSNELLDWTDIDAAFQLWGEMTHPTTGRPVSINPGDIDMLVMPPKLALADHILGATQVTMGDADDTAPNISGIRHGPNPVKRIVGGSLNMNASMLAYYLLKLATALGGGGLSASDASKVWLVGAFKKAFRYRQNYPLTIITRGAGTDDEFDRDVVFSIRASERGVAVVTDPRYVVKCTS